MTLFEFAVPLVALTIAGLGAVLLRAEAHRVVARRRNRSRLGK
jgi:hypothetical protein